MLVGPALALAMVLAKRRVPVVTRVLLPVLVLVVDPFAQVVLLEPMDDLANEALGQRARDADLVGKTPDDVLALFGMPDRIGYLQASYIVSPTEIRKAGEACLEWDYQPLGFYWAGSKLQIFFSQGANPVVMSIDPNDD